MPNPSALALTTTDAMTIAIVATEAFTELRLDARTAPDLLRGAVLLYDALLQRVVADLPQTPELQHVVHTADRAHVMALEIRQRLAERV